jgi:cytochrome c-type biogenesis protein CcmF
MLADLGFFSLVLACATAVYAAAAAVWSARTRDAVVLNSARTAAWLTIPLTSVAAFVLILLLTTGHYDIHYVYSVINDEMPLYLKITALWGGQEGSLLFWAWLMSFFTGGVMLRKWQRDVDLMPAVTAVCMVTMAFFISLILFVENPFARMWQTGAGETVYAMWQPAGTVQIIPADGRGLNPLLRHPGMIIHPPLLYLGFVSLVVPYAFAVAALLRGRSDDEWLRTTRAWTLSGWLFLSLGLILGGRWAYDVLGWGGYWGWDPVENAAFMPWLTATAFIHSAMIQEKRGMLKRWNVILVMLTYGLMLFGTFITRSGLLSSVHTFALSEIGHWFFVFITGMMVFSLVVLWRSWPLLKSEQQLDGLLSRESAFLLNNLLLLGITAAVFWGTVFPMISELLNGERVTVGPPYYNMVVVPLFAGLILLMGVAPLIAWRKASARALGRLMLIPLALSLVLTAGLAIAGVRDALALFGVWLCLFVTLTTVYEFVRGAQARMKTNGENAFTALSLMMSRNRRRYGGYIVHLGVVIIALGFIGSTAFQQETQGRLDVGDTVSLGRYTLRYDGLYAWQERDRDIHSAEIAVFRDGQYLTTLYPRRDLYLQNGQPMPMTIPGVRSAIEDDVYVLLLDWEGFSADSATFKTYINPLVNWIWFGGLVFIAGTLLSLWPQAGEARRQAAIQAGSRATVRV